MEVQPPAPLNFLKETSPSIAVISCGYKKYYGHPHKSTLQNLESVNAKIFRTDQNGSMQFYSDGEKFILKLKSNIKNRSTLKMF